MVPLCGHGIPHNHSLNSLTKGVLRLLRQLKEESEVNTGIIRVELDSVGL